MEKRQTIRGRVLLKEESGWLLITHGRRLHMTPPFPEIETGDLVEVVAEPHDELRWKVSSYQTLTKYKGDGHFPESDSDWAYFHGQNGPNLQVLKQMAQLRKLIRTFFDNQGFLEVETPAIGRSPGLEVHLEAMEVTSRWTPEGPKESRWLMTSPEYHMKRLLSADFQEIYQLARSYRSGETGIHHHPEFAMLEWYRAFSTWDTGPLDTQNLVQFLAGEMCESHRLPGWHQPIDVGGEWERCTIRESFVRWAGFDPEDFSDAELIRKKGEESGIQFSSVEVTAADTIVRILVEKVEPNLPLDRPFILTHYPMSVASLAQPSSEIPGTAERFEIYLGGLELANGFGELTDWKEQERRFLEDLEERKRLGLDAYPVDDRFLRALRSGIPPSMGIALGVERMAMGLLGIANITHLLPFPSERM